MFQLTIDITPSIFKKLFCYVIKKTIYYVLCANLTLLDRKWLCIPFVEDVWGGGGDETLEVYSTELDRDWPYNTTYPASETLKDIHIRPAHCANVTKCSCHPCTLLAPQLVHLCMFLNTCIIYFIVSTLFNYEKIHHIRFN